MARDATWTSERDTSMCCPFPVLASWSSPARILVHVYSPVDKSVIATPTFTGGPSCSPTSDQLAIDGEQPVICINPISASTMTS